MTTQSWSFGIDHQSDAGFRAWGSDFAAKLAAVGMVQTADTGQINWATVTRPGINTDAGYEIWTFNDSLQGTAPIFIRFNYGTVAGASRPRIQVIVGTGSNGSGTITGPALTGTLLTQYGGSANATGVALTSYMCHTEGIFWFVWGASGSGADFPFASLAISRTFDSDGAPTVTGALALDPNAQAGGSASDWTSLRFASTAAVYTRTGSSTASPVSTPVPSGATSTLVGGNPQAFLFWTWTPQVIPVLIAAVKASEIAEAVTFSATLIGTSARTFISMGGQMGLHWVTSSFAMGIALIWE